jgi:hypothetical protein
MTPTKGEFMLRWRDAILLSKLRTSTKAVGWSLSCYMSAKGSCQVAELTLARGASVSRRTVDQAITELAEAGLLSIERSVGKAPHRYQAVLSPGAGDKKAHREALQRGNRCHVTEVSNVANGDKPTWQITTSNVAAVATEGVRAKEKKKKEAPEASYDEVERLDEELVSESESPTTYNAPSRPAFPESRYPFVARCTRGDEVMVGLHIKNAAHEAHERANGWKVRPEPKY